MIEHIPKNIKNAFIYLHSADTNSKELKPFMTNLIEKLPNTYIWAGDGFISGSPLMNDGTFYGQAEKKYWFMFPMQDNCTENSFAVNSEAMGASLLSAGAFLNNIIDQIKNKYSLSADKIIISGFQHGSCLALASSMMRKDDPLKYVILFEPYILEGYYLQKEFIQKKTTVVCIENNHILKKVKNWIQIETSEEFKKYGMNIQSIILNEGEEKLDQSMFDEAIKIVKGVI